MLCLALGFVLQDAKLVTLDFGGTMNAVVARIAAQAGQTIDAGPYGGYVTYLRCKDKPVREVLNALATAAQGQVLRTEFGWILAESPELRKKELDAYQGALWKNGGLLGEILPLLSAADWLNLKAGQSLVYAEPAQGARPFPANVRSKFASMESLRGATALRMTVTTQGPYRFLVRSQVNFGRGRPSNDAQSVSLDGFIAPMPPLPKTGEGKVDPLVNQFGEARNQMANPLAPALLQELEKPVEARLFGLLGAAQLSAYTNRDDEPLVGVFPDELFASRVPVLSGLGLVAQPGRIQSPIHFLRKDGWVVGQLQSPLLTRRSQSDRKALSQLILSIRRNGYATTEALTAYLRAANPWNGTDLQWLASYHPEAAQDLLVQARQFWPVEVASQSEVNAETDRRQARQDQMRELRAEMAALPRTPVRTPVAFRQKEGDFRWFRVAKGPEEGMTYRTGVRTVSTAAGTDRRPFKLTVFEVSGTNRKWEDLPKEVRENPDGGR